MDCATMRKKSKQGILIYLCAAVCATTFCDAGAAGRNKRHEVEFPGGTHSYNVQVRGTLDEFNTAAYLEAPLGLKNVGSRRLVSRFQPNKLFSIANIGEKDIVNPRIVINGRRNWYSAEDILSGIIKPGMSTSEKALAIWGFVNDIEVQCHDNDRRVGSGSISLNKELSNPVKFANCYYCSGCQFAATVIVVLCQKAGIPAEDTRTVGLGGAHRIAEIRWDGDWHVLDGDERMFHLERDNKTLASIADIGKDTELCDRTHGGGFASWGLTKKRGKQYKDLKKRVREFKDITPYLSTMSMTLRPGEKFVLRWDNIGKYRCGANRRNIKPDRPDGLMPYQLANAKMVYQPKFREDLFERSIVERHNLHSVIGSGGYPVLQTIEAGKPGHVIYKITTCYPIVGARAGIAMFQQGPEDWGRIYISVYEPNDFKEVLFKKGSPVQPMDTDRHADIDDILNPKPTEPIYQYFVKYEIFAHEKLEDIWIEELYILTDVQMSATALPSLSAGFNKVRYSDDSGRGGLVRITHIWQESSVTKPPAAPAAAAEPDNGGSITLKELKKLTWQEASDPDGFISDYHIQVSTRPDMLYPVSPNFDRITYASHPLWPVPKDWLREGQTYYWKVRARDNWGVWSKWSDVWNFTITPSKEPEK